MLAFKVQLVILVQTEISVQKVQLVLKVLKVQVAIKAQLV